MGRHAHEVILAVAPSFHREVIVVFSMRPASLPRVCVRPAETTGE